jgi:calcineurin-like phosphoesterase family protein
MATWFTSDTHFYHANVITYCKRPFLNLEGFPDVLAMNKALVDNWNAVVDPEDTVYHLGDFAMGPRRLLAHIRSLLHGRVVLVRGNHDRSATACLEAGFNMVVSSMVSDVDGCRILLQHHPPQPSQEGQFDYILHGHIHEKYRRIGNAINVGVDVWNYKPVSFQELIRAEQSATAL